MIQKRYEEKDRTLSRFITTLFTLACDKQDFTVSSPLAFEKDPIYLNADKQTIDIKANHTAWYMRVYEVNASTKEYADTINGDWFKLVKKDKGEYLSISIESNPGTKRSLQIEITNGMKRHIPLPAIPFLAYRMSPVG